MRPLVSMPRRMPDSPSNEITFGYVLLHAREQKVAFLDKYTFTLQYSIRSFRIIIYNMIYVFINFTLIGARKYGK